MFSPIVRHRWLERGRRPGEVQAGEVADRPAPPRSTAMPSPVTRLMTPGGSPAASSSRIVWCAANCWVTDGFHTTVLPISAGAVGRLPAIAVKLNGVIATTKPSSGRWSNRFHTPADERAARPGAAVRSGR